MTVTFRLLGAVQALVAGQPLKLGHARQRCVLAILLVDANQMVSVDQLVDRVWADRPPHRARGTLYSYLSRLRRLLSSGHGGLNIERLAGGYILRVDPDTVDLHQFRRLLAQARVAEDDDAAALSEEALGLWHGEALADVDTPWAQDLRQALRAERWAAELDHTDLRLRQGRHTELLAGLATRAQLHPMDERLAGQLMLAQYRCGRQADALHHYEQTRKQLAEELGTDPSRPLQELHQRILRGDPELSAPAKVASRDEPVPHQFPAAPRSFIGREGELAALTAAVNHEAAHGQMAQISALAGAGGIGKTWLALQWAHTYRDRFPDGQLFVDLLGFSPANAPMEPPVVIRGFLDGLGVTPDRIPPDPHAQAALYRSLVADKQMLIVLDNAADAGQVIPLLPGSPTCTVLVTSRRHLATLITRYGAHHLQLEILTHQEAHALLTKRLGPARIAAEPDAADELIRLCGRYPLALAIMTRHAHTRPRIPLDEFATELRDLGLDALDNDDDPTASLPAVLSWSLRSLTSEQRTVFALMGIAPGADIGLPAAASLAGLPRRHTSKALGTLEEASLLVRRPGGRYAMHDLIRDYATTTADSELSDDAKEAALQRVLSYYTRTAYAADRLLDPHRPPIRLDPPVPGTYPHPLPDDSAAMAWFEGEHANLLAAQHTAVAHAWHDTVWHLAWALHTFHLWRAHRHDRLAVWRAGLDAAEHLPDPAARIRAHRLLGDACVNLKHHEEAIEHLHEALALADHHHDLTEQALAHHVLSWAWAWQGDDRRALDHATRTLTLFRTVGRPVWEARALSHVGWLAAQLGDYDSARAHCQAALPLYRHDDPNGRANVLDSLGYIEHHTGHHDRAIHYYEQSITLCRENGNLYQLANTLEALGRSHAGIGHSAQGRAAWQEALELYRHQGREQDAEGVQQQLDTLGDTSAGNAVGQG